MRSMEAFFLFTEIEFSFTALRASPLDFKNPDIEDNKSIIPLEKFGAQCMSMGLLIDEQTPIMWRGTMVISADNISIIDTFPAKSDLGICF